MDKEAKVNLLNRLVHYTNLQEKIRTKYSLTIETRTSGSHTEVRIHNTDRKVESIEIDERCVGVNEDGHETFIRCAERLLQVLEPKAVKENN